MNTDPHFKELPLLYIFFNYTKFPPPPPSPPKKKTIKKQKILTDRK